MALPDIRGYDGANGGKTRMSCLTVADMPTSAMAENQPCQDACSYVCVRFGIYLPLSCKVVSCCAARAYTVRKSSMPLHAAHSLPRCDREGRHMVVGCANAHGRRGPQSEAPAPGVRQRRRSIDLSPPHRLHQKRRSASVERHAQTGEGIPKALEEVGAWSRRHRLACRVEPRPREEAFQLLFQLVGKTFLHSRCGCPKQA
ncbi:hypothetical protein LMG27174_02482 [Paraburkholderia rhynchosiae]|uniref:Uncharacterized protein n=1 Tax=Paraburkholderia rhynchosiae TaxID=487049 RepID=A0A6J5ASI4_9BURK|nr:hypothetical protein LMG27174_02482 [Paraburkholderia rhynchosiae]